MDVEVEYKIVGNEIWWREVLVNHVSGRKLEISKWTFYASTEYA